MPGNRKYTVYAPPMKPQLIYLNKLFHSSDAVMKPLTQDLVGQEAAAHKAVIEIAKQYLQPKAQFGDPMIFPNAVMMDFSAAPNIADVKWTNPGDPANPYMADLTSPGPLKTGGKDRDVDPKIAASEVKPNYVPGAPDTGTKSPATVGSNIYTANELGTTSQMGASGEKGAVK
jgi:hypothetical protein